LLEPLIIYDQTETYGSEFLICLNGDAKYGYLQVSQWFVCLDWRQTQFNFIKCLWGWRRCQLGTGRFNNSIWISPSITSKMGISEKWYWNWAWLGCGFKTKGLQHLIFKNSNAVTKNSYLGDVIFGRHLTLFYVYTECQAMV